MLIYWQWKNSNKKWSTYWINICLFQTILVTLVLMSLAVASSQDYSQLFAGFGPYLRQSAVMRDPRSNRGKYVNSLSSEPFSCSRYITFQSIRSIRRHLRNQSGLDSNSNSNSIGHNFHYEYETSICELAVNSISAVHVPDEAWRCY